MGAQPRVQVTEKKKAVTLCNQATPPVPPKQRQGRLAVQGLGTLTYHSIPSSTLLTDTPPKDLSRRDPRCLAGNRMR